MQENEIKLHKRKQAESAITKLANAIAEKVSNGPNL